MIAPLYPPFVGFSTGQHSSKGEQRRKECSVFEVEKVVERNLLLKSIF